MLMQWRQFQFARVFGIPLMIDYSWLPMVALHIWLVSQLWLAPSMGDWLPQWAYYALGVAVTALFFASILIHELAHALIARLEGLQIYDIQLHIFGGWARLLGEPSSALAELRIAIAGPASSFLLAVFFWLCLFAVQMIGSRNDPVSEAAASSFYYLVAANILLAMFNLLPGLPLDGGRALRAILWHRRKDVLSATRTAKSFGVAIAYMLISYGLFMAVYGFYRGTFWRDLLAATWLLIVGVFLMNAAEQDYRYRVIQHAEEQQLSRQMAKWKIAGTVGAIMKTPPISILPELSVSEFLDRVLTNHRQTIFPVALEGRLHGMLLLRRLREIPQNEWDKLAVRDVMEPVEEAHFVSVRASIEHAVHKVKAGSLGHLAVLDHEGLLVGSLSEEELNGVL
jgi:Zn-dependent protease/CBS domain-containing protein